MAPWASFAATVSFVWMVASWLGISVAQDRFFFRHYAARLGPLPKPYDDARPIRSLFERGLSPRNARRTLALRTPLADPWLDRRRRAAVGLQWLWAVLFFAGFIVIAIVSIALFP